MSVKGDLVAALVTRGWLPEHEAVNCLRFILDCAASPDFAYKYADEETSGAARSHPEHNEQMHAYFNVIEFLRQQI